MSDAAGSSAANGEEFVTFEIAGRLFGAPVSEVNDVFALHGVTPVPLARPDVAGLMNLRGRIITVIDARRRLGLSAREGGYKSAMAIGIERDGESYGLIVDALGEVLRLEPDQFEENPVNLDEAWRTACRGVYRLRKGLLLALDMSRMLDAPTTGIAVAA
jgi:purine-binding chemotaxis protein CheW